MGGRREFAQYWEFKPQSFPPAHSPEQAQPTFEGDANFSHIRSSLTLPPLGLGTLSRTVPASSVFWCARVLTVAAAIG